MFTLLGAAAGALAAIMLARAIKGRDLLGLALPVAAFSAAAVGWSSMFAGDSPSLGMACAIVAALMTVGICLPFIALAKAGQ